MLVALLAVGGLPPSSILGPLSASRAAADPPPPSPTPSTYLEEVVADGPTSVFLLDEIDGGTAEVPASVSDSAGQDWTASFLPGVTVAAPPLLTGSVASVRGGAQGVFVSAGLEMPDEASPRSVEAWVEMPCGMTGCVGGVTPDADGVALFTYGDRFGVRQLANGSLRVTWGPTTGQQQEVATWGSDAWSIGDAGHAVHLVMTFDGFEGRLFVDGQLVWSATIAPFTLVPGSGFEVGAPGSRVDEVAVYPMALSADRVGVHFAKGSVVTGQPCGIEPTDLYGVSVVDAEPLVFYRLNETEAFSRLLRDVSGSCANASAGRLSTSISGVSGLEDGTARRSAGSAATLFASHAALPNGDTTRSIETWFQGTGDGPILDTGDGLALAALDGDIVIRVNGATASTVSMPGSESITDGSWHLIDLSYDATSGIAALFIDGPEPDADPLWSAAVSAPTASPFGVGSLTLWGGMFDEVVVYPTVLGSATVDARWSSSDHADSDPGACDSAAPDRYADTVLADEPERYYRLDDLRAAIGPVFAKDVASVSGCVDARIAPTTAVSLGALDGLADSGVAQYGAGLLSAPSTGLPAGGDDRTIEAWLRPTGAGTFGTSVEDQWLLTYGDGFGFATAADPEGNVRVRWGDADDYVDVATAPEPLPGQTPQRGWKHVVASLSNGSLSVYVDGDMEWTGPVVVDTDLAGGAFRAGLDATVNGPVGFDEIAAYDHALDATTVLHHFIQGSTRSLEEEPIGESPSEPDLCPVPSSAGHVQRILEDGPTAFYRFGELADDPNGRVAFDEVSCQRAEYGTASSYGAPSSVNGALSGDPNTGVARTLNAADSGRDQPAAWIPLDGQPVGTAARTIEFWGRAQPGIGLAFAYGHQFVAFVDPAGNWLDWIGPAPKTGDPSQLAAPITDFDTAWHHFAIAAENEQATYFVDGQVVGTSPMIMAGDPTMDAEFAALYAGQFDELAIYPHVLAPATVTEHYENGRRNDTNTSLNVPANLSADDTVRLEAEVQPSDPAAAALGSGAVQFYDGSTLLDTVEVADGTAELDVEVVTGVHTFAARYTGTITESASRSATVGRSIDGPDGPSLDLEVDLLNSSYGQVVTARVSTSLDPGDTAPGNDIQISVDGIVRRTVTLDPSSADAEATLPYLTPGDHVVTAELVGDEEIGEIDANEVAINVTPAVPDIQIDAINSEGQQIEVQGRIVRPDGGSNPTGTVTLHLDGDPADTATLWVIGSSTGDAVQFRLTANGVPYGDHDVRISYGGDLRFAAGDVEQTTTFAPPPPTAHIVLDNTTVPFGGYVTGRVEPDDPSNTEVPAGWVTLREVDGDEFGGSAIASDGTISVHIANPGVVPGTFALKASFWSADDRFASTPEQVGQDLTVIKASTSLALDVAARLDLGVGFYEASVAVDSESPSPEPTGFVTVNLVDDDPVVLALDQYGQATAILEIDPTTRRQITASYGGDILYDASSAELQPRSDATIEIDPTVVVGQHVAGRVVATDPEDETLASGQVLLRVGAQTETVTLGSDGTFVGLDTSEWVAGGDLDIEATYSGDPSFEGSFHEESLSVLRGDVDVSITVEPSIGALNRPSTIRASITAADLLGLAPVSEGTVTFFDGATAIGSAGVTCVLDVFSNCPLGTAQLTIADLALGSHELTATYESPNAFSEASSEPVSYSVRPGVDLQLDVTGNTQHVGDPLTVAVSVAPDDPLGGEPLGTLVLVDNGQVVASIDAVNGPIEWTNADPAPGVHELSAHYTDYLDQFADTTVTSAVNVTYDATLTGAPRASSIAIGDSVIVDAHVQTNRPAVPLAPGGLIMVHDELLGRSIGLGPLDENGDAQIVTEPLLETGAHQLSLFYVVSGLPIQTIVPLAEVTVFAATTVVELTTASTSVTWDTPVTVAATVTTSHGVRSTGTLRLLDDSGDLVADGPILAGEAEITLPTLPVGSHSLTAEATSTSGTELPTESNTLAITVVKATPSLTLSTSDSNAAGPVDATACVRTSTGTAVQGDVTVGFDADTPVTFPLIDGCATWTLEHQPGLHEITASFAETGTLYSRVAAIEQRFGNPTTLTVDSIAPTSVTAGGAIVIAGHVIAANPGSPSQPTGTVYASGSSAEIDPVTGAFTLAWTPTSQHVGDGWIGTGEVRYFGDDNFASAVDTTPEVTVAPADTITSVLLTDPYILAGTDATVEVSVVRDGGGFGPRSGTVELYLDDETAPAVSGTISSEGHVELHFVAPTSGAHTITARFNGTDGYLVSEAGTTFTVGRPTVTALNVEPTAPHVGQTITLTAAVETDGPIPTGDVDFYDNDVLVDSVALDNGVATKTIDNAIAGNHHYRAEFAGDGYLDSEDLELITVLRRPTHLDLTADPMTSVWGDDVVIEAELTTTIAGTSPNGTLYFYRGDTTGELLGTDTTTDGLASLTIGDLDAGTHTVTVAYLGNGQFAGTDTTITITVDPVATTIGEVDVNEIDDLTGNLEIDVSVATANGRQINEGQITLRDGTTVVATGTVENGRAVMPIELENGCHTLTAQYDGTPNANQSPISAPIDAIVRAAPDIAANPTTATARFGQTNQINVSVATNDGCAPPSGAVWLKDGTTTLGSYYLDATGGALIDISDLEVGDHELTIDYPGDEHTRAGDTNVVIEVLQADTIIDLASTTSPSDRADNVAFSATVSAVAPGSGQPTGTVTFTITGHPDSEITATINSSGTATADLTFASDGTHTVTATYEGTDSYSTSFNSVEQVVLPATNTQITTQTDHPKFGNPLTHHIVVSTVDGPIPEGIIVLTNDAPDTTPTTLDLAPATADQLIGLGLDPVADADRVAITVDTDEANVVGDVEFRADFIAANPAQTSRSHDTTDVYIDQATATAAITFAGSHVTSPSVNTAASVPRSDHVSIRINVTTDIVGTPPPTGDVVLRDGNTIVATVPLVAGQASVTTNNLSIGRHALTADFAGEPRFAPTSIATVLDVTPARTITTVTTVTATAEIAEQMEFDISVASAIGGLAVTEAPVRLFDGAISLGSAILDEDGNATMSVTLPAGERHLTARWGGDGRFAASQSTPVEVLVKQPVRVTAEVVQNPGVFGQDTEIEVTVTPRHASDTTTPTGTVEIRRGDEVLAPSTQITGSTVVSLQGLTAGTHHLTAIYTAAGAHSDGQSEPTEVEIQRRAAHVVVTASPALADAGANVTLDAFLDPINGVYPHGFVTFLDADGDPLSVQPVDADGVASFTTDRLPAGTNSISVRYGSDDNNLAASSEEAAVVQVTATGPTVDVTAPPIVRENQTIRIAVEVDTPNLKHDATGRVQLWEDTGDDQEFLGYADLDEAGAVTYTCPTPGDTWTPGRCSLSEQGDHELWVSYDGDDRYSSAQSARFHVTIAAPRVAEVALTTDSATAFAGRPVNLNVAVTDGTGDGAGAATPTGTVTISDPDHPVGIGRTVAVIDLEAGVGDIDLADLVVGTHQLVATYSGDDIYNPALADTTMSIQIDALNSIAVMTPPRTTTVGVPTEPITVELRDTAGTPLAAPAGGVRLDLVPPGGAKAISAAGGTDEIESVTVAEGETTASFRILGTLAYVATADITANPAFGASKASSEVTLTAGAVSFLKLDPEVAEVQPGSSTDFTVWSYDEYLNIVDEVTDQVGDLIADDPGVTCAATNCTVTTAVPERTVTATLGAATGTATISGNRSPIVSIDTLTVDPTDRRRQTVTVSTSDPDGDDLSFILYWGDETIELNGPVPASPDGPTGTTTMTFTHTFETEGVSTIVFAADDGNSQWPAWVTRNSEPVLPIIADAGDPQSAVAGDPVTFDAGLSSPTGAISTYTWTIRGEEFDGQIITHTFDEPSASDAGDTVHLEITDNYGRTASTDVAVHITDPSVAGDTTPGVDPTHALSITVVDAITGTNLSGATVAVTDAHNIVHRAVTVNGIARIAGLPNGDHTVSAVTRGYEPGSVVASITGGADEATIELDEGRVTVASVTSRRLTIEELVALGVDINADSNNHIFYFAIVLRFPDGPQTFSGFSSPMGVLCGKQSGPPTWRRQQDCGGVSASSSNGDDLSWMVLPGRAKWLKEMFSVDLHVTNLADPGFTLAPGTATLNLPTGVSLAEMVGDQQRRTLGVEAVPGGQTRTTRWIVRGDTEGLYRLSADYSSVLDPFGTPVRIHVETNDANRLRVWGASALEFVVHADDQSTAYSPYTVWLSLRNKSDAYVYNAEVRMTPLPTDEGLWYAYQPGERMSDGTGRIAPGQTYNTHRYLLVPTASRKLDIDSSSVKVFAAGATPAMTVKAEKPAPPPPEVTITGSDNAFAPATVTLTWDPVPGALGYEIYNAESIAAGFNAQPIAHVEAPAHSVALEPREGGIGIVAVSTIMPGTGTWFEGGYADYNTLRHRVINGQGRLDSTPSPTTLRGTDPCVGYGQRTSHIAPGNLVAQATDATVNSPGPSLGIDRTYNSLATEGYGYQPAIAEPFGPGWAWNWGITGLADRKGNIALLMGDGHCIPVDASAGDQSTNHLNILGDGESYTLERIVGATQVQTRNVLRNRTDGTVYTLDGWGRLQSIRDASKRSVTVHYPPALSTDGPPPTNVDYIEDDSSGRTLTMTYNEDGQITEIATDPVTHNGITAPYIWRYYYEARQLTAVCDPRDNRAPADGGLCTRYDYTDGRLATITRPSGTRALDVDYYLDGRLETTTNGTGNTTTFDYSDDPVSGVTTRIVSTNPRGVPTIVDVDRRYRIVGTENSGLSTQLTYDQRGYLTSQTSSNGDETTTSYDDTGSLTSYSDSTAMAVSITTEAAPNDETIRTISSGGPESTIHLDSNGRRIRELTPSPSEGLPPMLSTWAYSTEQFEAGHFEGTTPTDPGVWVPDRFIGTTEAEGGGVVPPGMLISVNSPVPDGHNPSANSTTYSYDQHGDLVLTTSPTGTEMSATYDELGRKTSVTALDPTTGSTSTTTVAYDPLGNVVSQVDPTVVNPVTGQSHMLTTTVGIDADGNEVSTTQSDSAPGSVDRVKLVDFDAAGRPTTERTRVADGATPTGFSTTTRHYDAAGNMDRVTDGRGDTVRTRFDTANRPTEVWLEDFADPNNPTAAKRDIRVLKVVYDAATGRQKSTTDALGRRIEYGYDDNGRQVRTTLANFRDPATAATRPYVLDEITGFDSQGKPRFRLTDDRTRIVASSYDNLGRIVKTTLDPAEYVNGAGETISPPNALDRSTSYGYDAAGNVVQVTQTGASTGASDATRSWSATYDAAHRRTSVTTDPGGLDLTTSYEYDGFGRTIAVVDANGNSTETTYDPLGRVSRVARPPVPSPANPAILVRPEERFGYNAFGNRTSLRDVNDAETAIGFDPTGRPSSITLPTYTRPGDEASTPAVTLFAYDAVGNRTQMTEPGPTPGTTVVKQWDYDALGRVTRTAATPIDVNGATAIELLSYDDGNRLVETVDRTGASQTMSYDSLDRLTSSTVIERPVAGQESAELTTTYRYDARGNMVRSVDPTGATTTATYDAADAVTTATDAVQQSLATPKRYLFDYDTLGQLVASTDPLGRINATEYDTAGRTTAVRTRYREPDDTSTSRWITTSFGYDNVGNRTSVTTPNGQGSGGSQYSTNFDYDTNNRLTRIEQPIAVGDSATTEYGYDLASNITSMRDGLGRTTRYTYNSWGLLEKTIEPPAVTEPEPGDPEPEADRTWELSYNARGLIDLERQPGGVVVSRTFDSADNVTLESASGGGTVAATRTFAYDPSGRVTRLGSPTGDISFRYNDRGLVLAQTSGTSTDPQMTFRYDRSGHLSERTSTSGTSTFTYDANGQLQTATDPVSGTRSDYQYDAAGQLASQRTLFDHDLSETELVRTFDDLGRPIAETTSSSDEQDLVSQTTTYDDNSTVTGRTLTTTDSAGDVQAETATYGHDRAGRLTSWTNGAEPPVEFHWDKAGNRTWAGTTEFNYDQRNRLISTNTGSTYSWSPNGTRTTHTTASTTETSSYDGFGRLVTHATGGTGGATVNYTYDSLDRVATRNTAPFTYAGGSIKPTTIGDIDVGRDAAGKVTSSRVGSAAANVVQTNSRGDAVARNTSDSATGALLDPFGNRSASAPTDSLGYQSDYTDPASSQVWMGARFYDPATATFTTRDTWSGLTSNPVTLNRYTYANADPATFNDPTGHFVEFDFFVRGGGANNWITDAMDTSNSYNPVAYAFDEAGHYEPMRCDDSDEDVLKAMDQPLTVVLSGDARLACRRLQDLVAFGMSGQLDAADIGPYCREYDADLAHRQTCRILMVKAVADYALRQDETNANDASRDRFTSTIRNTLLGAAFAGAVALAISAGIRGAIVGAAQFFSISAGTAALASTVVQGTLTTLGIWFTYKQAKATIKECKHAASTGNGWDAASCSFNGMLTLGSAAGTAKTATTAYSSFQKTRPVPATNSAPFGEIGPAGNPGSLNTVIGKVDDLTAPGALAPGERSLLSRLPDQGSPAANYAQNSSVLRQEMSRGVPIRDATVDPLTGGLANNTGFLRAEREILMNHGWTFDPKTGLWNPPG